jgi:hypothetical protein
VLTFFAQDSGTRNLVYGNAGISKATQAREAIAFCDHWKQVTGADPEMLGMYQKVTTRDILGELGERDVKFITLRMRSAALMKRISSLTSKDYKTVTLDRPGPHNRPKVHEDAAVTLTSYPAPSASSSSPAWAATSPPSSSPTTSTSGPAPSSPDRLPRDRRAGYATGVVPPVPPGSVALEPVALESAPA